MKSKESFFSKLARNRGSLYVVVPFNLVTALQLKHKQMVKISLEVVPQSREKPVLKSDEASMPRVEKKEVVEEKLKKKFVDARTGRIFYN